MSFRLGRGGKRAQDVTLYEVEQVIWGVPRRAGLDEQDDPKAHGGLTQHAFEIGNDERAICGFEPPKRASGPTAKPRAQLAVPNSRLNPRCPKCLKLIAVPAVIVEPAEPEATDDAVGDEGAAADEAMVAEVEMTDEEAPTAEVVAAARIGEAEVEGPINQAAAEEVEPFDVADVPDASIMAIVAPPDPEPEPDAPPDPAREPEPTSEPPPAPAMQPGPPANQPNVPPPPPPPATADAVVKPRPAIDPPMSMRSASWEGTVVYHAGQQTALVRPPSQPGMGVVASVISGPSGTRVGSVQINADGLAVISLSEPARGPVSVAWFAVPAVDETLHQGQA